MNIPLILCTKKRLFPYTANTIPYIVTVVFFLSVFYTLLPLSLQAAVHGMSPLVTLLQLALLISSCDGELITNYLHGTFHSVPSLPQHQLLAIRRCHVVLWL